MSNNSISNFVYVVVKSGPEWSNLISVYRSKKAANRCAHDLNKGRCDMDSAIERLSTYEVKTVPFVDR